MEQTDIVIIGAGASGAAAAWSLSQNPSLKIICLEQGQWQTTAGYPPKSADWELDNRNIFNSNPNERANPADYPIDCTESPIQLANFNAVGGSTVLYSGHFPRFHPSDFKTKTLDKVGDDWPFTYHELEPFFYQNDQIMKTAGLVGDPAMPPFQFLHPPVPMGSGVSKIAKAFNNKGWHWWPSYSAVNTQRDPKDNSKINWQPCNFAAARSVDISYWPLAIQQGVDLRPGCEVIDILLNSENRASAIIYKDNFGAEHKLEANLIILTCSAAGTPRLLLNCRSKNFPEGLLNNHDVVGRYLMLHPLGYAEAEFSENLKSSKGPPGCAIFSQEFYETRKEHDFVRGYTMHVLRGRPPLDTAVNAFRTRRLPLGVDHHKTFAKQFDHTIGIAVISEDLPEAENRIILDESLKLSSGKKGIKVKYKLSENSQRMLKHGLEKSTDVLAEAGGTVTHAFAPIRHTGWHIMGTARMGTDRKTSVVNSFGQAHDVPNLFIMDSSIFVTGGAVNPASTAQAVTLKLCAEVLKNIGSKM